MKILSGLRIIPIIPLLVITTSLSDEMITYIEIVMKTKNTRGNTVNFQANSQTFRWNTDFLLTNDYQSANLSIDGDNLSCYYGFGFGEHPGEITLVYSIYTIEVTNPGKSAWFKVDAIGCPPLLNGDIYVTYDWETDTFYTGGNCRTYGTNPVNYQTIKMFNVPIGLQPTTPTNLSISYTAGTPVLRWDLSEPSSAATYRIYREISTNPGFVQIGAVAAGTCQWTDNNFSTPNAFARYKIRTVSGDGNLESPDFSNNVQTDIKPTTPTNLHYENANGHPRLSWNLSEPQEAATYEVWRKVCSNPPKYSVIVEDWRWVQSLPAGTNNWTDNDFQISGTVNQASYRVRAVSGDGHLYSPSFSNTVTIAGEFLPFDRQPAPAVSLKPNNPSLAIFPNPFNNTLKITIDSPTEPITEMVIFDLRGRAVRRWVSLANPHQIIATWDGSNDQNQPLTSGVYCLLVQTTRHRLFREKILFIK